LRIETRDFGIVLTLFLLALAGCRQNMHDQHKVKTLAANDFFDDGQGARPLPAHTVARGDRREGFIVSGLDAANRPVAQIPYKVDRDFLRRGRERYDIFCSPCHDRVGNGRGMIVRRGYKQPSSYHIDRLRAAPVGYFVNVITEGFGVMPSYAPQVPVEDRWAIAAYIRVLQYSQNARLADLPPEARRRVESDLKGSAPSPPPAAGAHGAPPSTPGEVP
jgi:cbb3-type cytochrome c oxidase subunit III